jgi:hypothetical protein
LPGRIPPLGKHTLAHQDVTAFSRRRRAIRFSILHLCIGIGLFALGMGLGLAVGKRRAYDQGYQLGWSEAPLFDATHPRIGPLLIPRSRE